MNAITTANFSKTLSDTIKGATSVRAKIQALAEFSIEQACAERCDLGYLTRLYVACRDAKGIDHLRLKRFICASLPVYWRDAKDDANKADNVKPSAFCKEKGKAMEHTPQGMWYEYEPVKKEKKAAPVDVNAKMKRLIDALTDTLNDRGEIKVADAELRQQLAKVKELIGKIQALDHSEIELPAVSGTVEVAQAA